MKCDITCVFRREVKKIGSDMRPDEAVTRKAETDKESQRQKVTTSPTSQKICAASSPNELHRAEQPWKVGDNSLCQLLPCVICHIMSSIALCHLLPFVLCYLLLCLICCIVLSATLCHLLLCVICCLVLSVTMCHLLLCVTCCFVLSVTLCHLLLCVTCCLVLSDTLCQ